MGARDTIRIGPHEQVVRRPARSNWWNIESAASTKLDRQVRYECLRCGVQVQETPAAAEAALRSFPCRGGEST